MRDEFIFSNIYNVIFVIAHVGEYLFFKINDV
jgi:hypothetical protein